MRSPRWASCGSYVGGWLETGVLGWFRSQEPWASLEWGIPFLRVAADHDRLDTNHDDSSPTDELTV